MRVLGEERLICIRHPAASALLSPAGSFRNGAIATSGVAATRKSLGGREVSAPVVDGAGYSMVGPTCLVPDALTKVLAQVKRTDAAYFKRLGAMALITAPCDQLRVA